MGWAGATSTNGDADNAGHELHAGCEAADAGKAHPRPRSLILMIQFEQRMLGPSLMAFGFASYRRLHKQSQHSHMLSV